MKISQTKYRKKQQQTNQRNAAIVNYVEKHFPWVMEAFTIQNLNEKVITIFNFSSLY